MTEPYWGVWRGGNGPILVTGGGLTAMADLTGESGSEYVFHVYPTWGRGHVTEGFAGGAGACWCGPDLYRLCTACDREEGCWSCGGSGVVAVDAVVVGDKVIVAHHYIPDGEPIVDRRGDE